MKQMTESTQKTRPVPSVWLLLSACASVLFLAGCSGFMGPDARMGRPDPHLLSSRGGQLPQPETLGAEEPTPTDSRSYSSPAPLDPVRPPTSSGTENPYVTSIDPLDEDVDSSPDMDQQFDDSPPIRGADADEDMLPSTPETSPALSHRVKKGESLWVISRKYDVSVDELASYNDMAKDDVLRAGAVLDIPPGGTPPDDEQEAAQSTEGEDRGAERPTPDTGASAATPAGEEEIPEDGKYIVQSGDSLWKISRRFGVSIDDLREWNDLHSDVLQIGRVILLRPDANQTDTDTDNTMRPPRGRDEDRAWDEFDSTREQDEDEPAETANQGWADDAEDDAGMNDFDGGDFPQTLDHTVSRTDTLQNIADMYETSVDAIKQANPGVQDDDDLEYGMELVIPFE